MNYRFHLVVILRLIRLISVSKNHFKSIIGPNGAGKTTFFNLLSGQLKSTKGQILFNGEDITNLSPTKRTRKGMGRSFQITNVFPNLTVLENVRLAVQSQSGIRYQMLIHYLKYKELEVKAEEWLKIVLLDSKERFIGQESSTWRKAKIRDCHAAGVKYRGAVIG